MSYLNTSPPDAAKALAAQMKAVDAWEIALEEIRVVGKAYKISPFIHHALPKDSIERVGDEVEQDAKSHESDDKNYGLSE